MIENMIEANALLKARTNLSRYIVAKASAKARELGFSYTPALVAPDTYSDMLDTIQHCYETGKAYEVSSLFCDNTIYLSGCTNIAQRFWHDMGHYQSGLTFSHEDELELFYRYHAKGLPFKRNSLEYKLFRADLAGQQMCALRLHRFPSNQHDFVVIAAAQGTEAAIDATNEGIC